MAFYVVEKYIERKKEYRPIIDTYRYSKSEAEEIANYFNKQVNKEEIRFLPIKELFRVQKTKETIGKIYADRAKART